MTYKHILLCIGLLLPLQAFALDTLLQQAINNYKQVISRLAACRDQISINWWVSYLGNTATHHYKYICKSKEALETLKEFQKSETELDQRAFIAAFGDGFILGVLASCCNKLLKRKCLDKKTIITIVLTSMGLLFYQNRQAGIVPGYTGRMLTKTDDVFASAKFSTVLRLLCMLSSSAVGYFTTGLVWEKYFDTQEKSPELGQGDVRV